MKKPYKFFPTVSIPGLVLITAGMVMLSCSRKAQQSPDIPDVFQYNQDGAGISMSIEFNRGPAHNHPLFAIWLEDTSGTYIQTLYIAESIGKGVFNYGQASQGKWMPGEIRRPAALPYWAHKRNIPASDGLLLPTPEQPVPDAYTGPTPPQSFVMHVRSDQQLPIRFDILFEINQTWDWNEYWTNNKYPGDLEYKTSSQPALVYKARIDLGDDQKEYLLRPVGHSHQSGKTGELYTDLSTLTTALEIAREIKVIVEKNIP